MYEPYNTCVRKERTPCRGEDCGLAAAAGQKSVPYLRVTTSPAGWLAPFSPKPALCLIALLHLRIVIFFKLVRNCGIKNGKQRLVGPPSQMRRRRRRRREEQKKVNPATNRVRLTHRPRLSVTKLFAESNSVVSQVALPRMPERSFNYGLITDLHMP